MASDLTLSEAIRNYIAALKPEDRPTTAPELQRFSRWFGPERQLGELSAVQLERYQEQLDNSGIDSRTRLEPLRQFLSDARAKKLLDVPLASAIKVRRKTAAERAKAGKQVELQTVEMTQAGYDSLKAELERLETEERPLAIETMQRAAADKDFRENAPYDEAKKHRAEIERKIIEIREKINAAKIVSEASGERAVLGTTLVIRDLEDDEELTYTLVGPGDGVGRGGRISINSPVGQALVDKTVGETVVVRVPAGVHRFRIERIERTSS